MGKQSRRKLEGRRQVAGPLSFAPRTPLLARLFDASTPRQQWEIATNHEAIRERARENRANALSSEALALSWHFALDGNIERSKEHDPNAKRITCSKGCSACCHQEAVATPDEADLLARAVRLGGVSINRERLIRQSQAPTFDALAHADKACAFLLPSGECGVYQLRPATCRKYFVVSDPADCDIEKRPGQRVLNWISASAETLTSACFTEFGSRPLWELMAERLQLQDDPQP